MSTAIIIQGVSSYIVEQKNAWAGFDIIWSTWQGSEHLYDSNDNVIFNNNLLNSGIGNINLQAITTLAGIKEAKRLNYTNVLKWRSDLIPTNAPKLMELFKVNNLNFLAWHNIGKYFVDYFMFGNIYDIESIWNIDVLKGSFAEQILTNNIFKKGFKEFNFIANNLNNECDIFWKKYNINLSSYQQHPVYTVFL